jgi:hypothetical protein
VRTPASTLIFIAVVVLDARDGRVLGAFGIDDPTVYKRNVCAGEKRELPTCNSEAERVKEVKR